MSKKNILLLLPLMSGFLLSCSGSSSELGGDEASTDTDVDVLTGVFIDSEVANIAYRTDTQSGKTNSQGQFQYVAGESVIFSIGDIDMPEVMGGEQVTPFDIAGSDDAEDLVVVNISRLLQTLDTDGNADNGITISNAAHSSATGGESPDFSSATFEAEEGISALLNNGGGSNNLVSESDAISHLQSSLDTDNDGITNDSDDDDDGDGIPDAQDPNPLVADDTTTETNIAPVADAGDDQTLETGSDVTVDASGSADSDGDSLTYAWSFTSVPSNSGAMLADATAVSTSFNADVEGSYVLSLVVNDGAENSESNRLVITASTNNIPIANAGGDQSVATADTVMLSAALSSDADDDSLTYVWEFSAIPDGSSAMLVNASTSSPSFNADLDGSYVVTLVVNDGLDVSVIDSVTISANEVVNASTAAWIVNSGSSRSANILEDNLSQGALVNIISKSVVTLSNTEYSEITTAGIPNYSVTMGTSEISGLNSRPRLMNDFGSPNGTTADIGDVVEFGDDIGYNSADLQNGACKSTGGYGYWPPGPDCPTDQSSTKTGHFTHSPSENTGADCDTGLGIMGYMLNGTSIYNWGDGTSYNSQNVWELSAAVAEVYDVDICGGHAADGDYHHHFNSSCLEDTIGDSGAEHSPIYGYAADGYPVHGKWHASGVLAAPSWVARDYSDTSTSTSGCPNAVAGERSCILNNQFDISDGVADLTSTAGPSTSESYTTQSGNSVSAESGLFFQDYYYDSSLENSSAEYLDKHNGHNHDDYGYHYHITVESSDNATPKFPYIIGPTFYGELDDNAVNSCGGIVLGGGPPMM